MQAITAVVPSLHGEHATALSSAHAAAATAASSPLYADWMRMYTRRPHGNSSLFELEAMVAKRMELLAWIDQLSESTQTRSYEAMLDAIAARLPAERRARPSRGASAHNSGGGVMTATTTTAASQTILGVDDGDGDDEARRRSRSRSRGSAAAASSMWGAGDGGSGGGSAFAIYFDENEDVTSHLLCRYAFCLSERWRKWLVKTEELLLRARLRLEAAKRPFTFITELMTYNGLPCRALTPDEATDARVREYVEYRTAVATAAAAYGGGGGGSSSSGDGGARGMLSSSSSSSVESEAKLENYYSVPLSLATRLVRARKVLCHHGRAILFRDQVQEVFVVVFRTQLQRGLQAAYTERMQLLQYDGEGVKDTIMAMLDAFLEHFVRDPASAMAEQAAGAVTVGDVPRLAARHFPPCMRQIDAHLRRHGHLKHHGRFTYGLFLKAIGLSLEHALTLFATLMTEKGAGGGDVEAFARTSYGYNVRHNYGLEGKRTSYSSASCATLLALPPVVDKYDCHGCPFRFRDEAALRAQLLQSRAQRRVLSATGSNNSNGNNNSIDDDDTREVSLADLEDIVSDCKGQHYTRACYRYFMATHPGARRDTLFRSPYEYYCASRDYEQQQQQQQQQGSATVAVDGSRVAAAASSSASPQRRGDSVMTTPSSPSSTPGRRTMLTPARGGDERDSTRRRLE